MEEVIFWGELAQTGQKEFRAESGLVDYPHKQAEHGGDGSSDEEVE